MGSLMRQALLQFQNIVNRSATAAVSTPFIYVRFRSLNCNQQKILEPVKNIGQSSKMLSVSAARCDAPTYEGDGKTSVTILNSEENAWLMVDSYHQNGFRLNSGTTVLGPMAIFSNTVLGWDVGKAEDITPQSVSLLTVIEPKVSILIIGIGDAGEKVPNETIIYLKKHKINMEILPTDHACTTYNFMMSEKRHVAAIMIPPRKIRLPSESFVHAKLARDRLYKDDNE